MSDSVLPPRQSQRYFKRFSVNQRVQHVILMISVATLIVTGMPVFYSKVPASEVLIQWMGGVDIRGTLHRSAALVLLALGAYHLLYIVLSVRGRKEFIALMPERKDLSDLKGLMRYYFTRTPERPPHGRFSFFEKFEYLAVAWGMVIMGVTGLILWFPERATLIFPRWVLDVARVIHSYEALLAFLSIIIWHFYNVHLGPDVFPMSVTWLNGLLSEERMRHEHPAEYALVANIPDAWITVSAPLEPRRELAHEGEVPVTSRMKNTILAAGAGAGLGAIVPVLLLPFFVLTTWLLNPAENAWGPALLTLSIMLLPSCIAGAAMGTYMGMAGRSLSYSLVVCFSSLMGFYLAPLSLWVPLAAIMYVLQWFVPLGKLTGVIFLAVMVASIFLGLIGSFFGSVRGKAYGQSGPPLEHENLTDRGD